MLPIICLQYTKKLQETYAPKNTQVTQMPQFTQQEREKYEQTLKEQTQKYNERKKRKEQKFAKLNKEQITQLVCILKQDPNFLNQLSQGIIQHTEIAQLIKKSYTLKAIKQLNSLSYEFKQKMIIKIMNMFVTQQNKMYTKLKNYLNEKQQLLFEVLEKKLSSKFDYNELLKQQIHAQLNKILKLQIEDQCKKLAQQITSQLILLYDGITQLIGQHVESNKDNKLELEFYTQIQKVKEYFTSTEQLFIKRLQTDMSEYYGNAIQLIIQIQQKIK